MTSRHTHRSLLLTVSNDAARFFDRSQCTACQRLSHLVRTHPSIISCNQLFIRAIVPRYCVRNLTRLDDSVSPIGYLCDGTGVQQAVDGEHCRRHRLTRSSHQPHHRSSHSPYVCHRSTTSTPPLSCESASNCAVLVGRTGCARDYFTTFGFESRLKTESRSTDSSSSGYHRYVNTQHASASSHTHVSSTSAVFPFILSTMLSESFFLVL